MNYQSIWEGDEYAWSPDRPKGVFPMNGRRCKVLGKRKITYPGNTRQSAEVWIEYQLAQYGTEETKTQTLWVPAREIVDFWDNYESEVEHIKSENEAHREKVRSERMARERDRLQQVENRIVEFAKRTGLPRDSFTLLPDNLKVTITISALERRLGIDW